MKKNYSMKIPSAHLQMVSNKCTNFQKNPCTHFTQHAWNKIMSTHGGQTDRQTDIQRDRQTDRQTDGLAEIDMPPPPPKLRLRII